MSNVIATIGIYGDMHLNSKNYGAHRNYAKESLEYFHNITEAVRKNNITTLIGTGDFTFGRFHSLEYRSAIERELQEQYSLTNGNRYELKGNHDIAGYGMTERDYYVSKGLLKPSQNISIGNLNITMVDYNEYENVVPNIVDNESVVNLIVAHDYFKFNSTKLPNFGTPIELDHFEKWFGVDYIALGHIHKDMEFDGYMAKGDMVHHVYVNYLGCMMRPAYKEGAMDEKGKMLVIKVFDDGKLDIENIYLDLWSIEDSFNIEAKQKEAAKKAEKENRVDITDIVKQLDSHERNVGSPEEIIKGLEDIDDKYKNKAIDLLKMALG